MRSSITCSYLFVVYFKTLSTYQIRNYIKLINRMINEVEMQRTWSVDVPKCAVNKQVDHEEVSGPRLQVGIVPSTN